uniref:Uncharacterized protein n=1 Tax=Human betaherpesvirus 6 TaxID=10368 RepID=A0A1W6DEQ1_9BETA|nr:hypothetical protein [Human betaherpesvirus 6]ARK01758.2 hypothetical protein [Human betaherpesvirus 6]ARK02132.2 hypothetical protein [Human betaherpesvirus 6]ARK02712.2 hypothetical protein [Human betaherpesvirus 6]ARK02960.2 hypothetical protein [Human betaherpesvirus 6]
MWQDLHCFYIDFCARILIWNWNMMKRLMMMMMMMPMMI